MREGMWGTDGETGKDGERSEGRDVGYRWRDGEGWGEK